MLYVSIFGTLEQATTDRAEDDGNACAAGEPCSPVAPLSHDTNAFCAHFLAASSVSVRGIEDDGCTKRCEWVRRGGSTRAGGGDLVKRNALNNARRVPIVSFTLK